VQEARSPRERIVRVFFLIAASAALVIVLFALAVEGLWALYEYRSEKVTGESERAERAWPRLHRGMTDDAVTNLAGTPSARHGSCWAWGEGWFSDAATVYEVCFEDGRVVRKSRSQSLLDD
jgi:hypothetical protein